MRVSWLWVPVDTDPLTPKTPAAGAAGRRTSRIRVSKRPRLEHDDLRHVRNHEGNQPHV